MANIPPFEDEIRHARFPLPIPLPEGEGGNESLREFHVHVTVAAVIERDGKFLLVEEETSQGVRFNQPAGHLEADESLLTAVAREVLEESAYHFVPQHLLGIYRWHSPESDTTYLRFAFTGTITGHDADRPLDNGIIQALWLTPDEIRTMQARHRSPLIFRCIEDYLAGKRYPLELLVHYE